MDIDTKVTQPSVEEEPSECSDAMEIKDVQLMANTISIVFGGFRWFIVKYYNKSF